MGLWPSLITRVVLMLLIVLFPTTILELLCSSQVHYWVSYRRGEGVKSLVLCTTLWWSIGQPLLPGGPLNGSRNSTIHHSSFPSLFLHTLSLSFFPSIPQLLTRLGVAFHLFPTAYQFPSFSIHNFSKKKREGEGGEISYIFFCQSLSSKISAISNLDYTYRILGVLILLTWCFKGASLLGK